MTEQRNKFEAAVVKRLSGTKGYVEPQIRSECLERDGSAYVAEAINDMWHFWNEALWQNIPLVDPGFGQGPDGLDFATPDEVFDKGPEAVREWQEARGRKSQSNKPSPGNETITGETARGERCELPPPPSTHLMGRGTAEYAAAEAAFTDYFVRNYPGPDTVIFNPKWHAPKIFAAAAAAIRATTKE